VREVRAAVQIGACRLLCGDCRGLLPTVGPVDCVIADAPYSLALSIGLATLSYWSVEYPTRLLRYAFTGDGHLARPYSR
jgi:hypothetical protein